MDAATLADDLACVVKTLEAESEAIKSEAKKLLERAALRDAKVKSISAKLEQHMIANELKKLSTPRAEIWFKKSPPAVKLADEDDFIEWCKTNGKPGYYRTKTETKADKVAISAALKRGDELPGATLVQSERMYIK